MTTIRSRKAKGKRLQIGVAKIIREYFNLQGSDVRSTASSVGGEDIIFSELGRKIFPFSVECKNQEHINIWKAIEQSNKNAGNYTPIVIFSKNNSNIYVTIDLESFLTLIKYGVNSLEPNDEH